MLWRSVNEEFFRFDRPNRLLAQSAFARYVLNNQLQSVALLNPSLEGRTETDNVFNDGAFFSGSSGEFTDRDASLKFGPITATQSAGHSAYCRSMEKRIFDRDNCQCWDVCTQGSFLCGSAFAAIG